MTRNKPYDWIEKHMADQWAEWLCGEYAKSQPLLSPINADMRNLPPIYIQVGDAEILYDMICQFASNAEKQGAQIKLDVWHNMPHDFQAFGNILPQSTEALLRLADIVHEHIKN